MRFKTFWQNRILIPVLAILKQGVSPDKIALSIAFGITVGVFPVIGATTLLCLFAAFCFRLNQPATQLVNAFAYPLQLVLLIPFYHAGAFLFNTPALPLTASQVMGMLNTDVWNTVRLLWHVTLRAMVAWCLIAPIVTVLLFQLLRPAIRKLPFKAEDLQSDPVEQIRS
jgi:uncharacterized protein (DUF2062 family)